MSQLNPEHERYTRRVHFAGTLCFVSVPLVGVAYVLLAFVQYSGGFSLPSWLWLLPFVGACTLFAVAIALLFPVVRELRRQMPR